MGTKYYPTIGLEIHAELKTRTKMFCSSKNDPDEKHPNVNICPVCMGHPGTLPVANKEAIKKVRGKVGEDFTPEQEKKLCEMYPDSIVFTHSWPSSIKPFYIMTKDEKKDAKFSEGFDALYGGMEISSGGQRIHIPELLIKILKKKGLRQTRSPRTA